MNPRCVSGKYNMFALLFGLLLVLAARPVHGKTFYSVVPPPVGNGFPVLFYSYPSDVRNGRGIGLLNSDGKSRPFLKLNAPPAGLAFDSRGNMFFAVDNANHIFHLMKYDITGKLSDLGVIFRPAYGRPPWKLDLAVSPQGEVYFTHLADRDRGSGISKMDLMGKIIPIFASEGNWEPHGLAFSASGDLYFTNTDHANRFLVRRNLDGRLDQLGQITKGNGVYLTLAFDLLVGPQNEVYFPHFDEQTLGSGISKREPSGKITKVANSPYPMGLSYGRDGRLYFVEIADEGNDGGYRLMRLSAQGKVERVALIANTRRGYDASWTLDLAMPPPPVAVIAPKGGETMAGGTETTVTWRTFLPFAGTAVRIELFNSRGRVAHLGYDHDSAGEATKRVTLPLLPQASDYRIRVTSLWNQNLYAVSSAPFRITGKPLMLWNPLPGENWKIGSKQWVWWEVNPTYCGTAVRFELWKNGRKITDLGSSSALNGESISAIIVPSVTPGKNYKLRLVSAWDPRWYAERTISIVRR